MFTDLAGKTALVTGASGGLGAHFARLLASHGATVVLAARRTESLAKLRAGIEAAGGKATALGLDVTDASGLQQAVEGLAVDVLVNNAGIAEAGPALDITAAAWDRVFDTNLRGAMLLSQALAPSMQRRGGGAIVNIASVAGLRVGGNLAAYAASKAALIHLTKALALEWARHGIRVNALCPGYIETDLNRDFFATPAGDAMVKRIPQRRLGQPDDLDGPLLLLCSDAGRYMTGATLAVDGGHLVSSL